MESTTTSTSTGPVRIRRFVERHKAEGWTEPSVRWLVFKASENGLEDAGAIVRLGRRIFIDEVKFYSWLREQGRAA
jgi:hypothetical protein